MVEWDRSRDIEGFSLSEMHGMCTASKIHYKYEH